MIKQKIVKISQKIINRAYEKKGLTDKILDAQLRLNKIKHENDLTDGEWEQ